jgi:hypothetical protein
MSYDGHGRMLTRKYPVESAASSFVYNPDDTLQTMTDARGVTTTYGHNNRHLTTSITYGAAPNVIPLNPVTFGYDEVGNRLWMDDQPGRVDYHYNTLSQMEWEERQFDELTQVYRISYEYNLAGQLKKIVSPSGPSFTYVFNRAGEITDITGSGYIDVTDGVSRTVSQLATMVKYRAWNVMKSYTNGTVATDQSNFVYQYNQRVQLTRFDGGGRITDHTYYSDGRVKDVYDRANSNFDRIHEYDHVGRLSKASAGTTMPKPYDFTFAYDIWDNTTSRTGSHWTCPSPNLTSTYINDRMAGVQYDAAGNRTGIGNLFVESTMQYDSASRLTNERESRLIHRPVIHWNRTHEYDGDGQGVRLHSQKEGDSAYTRTYYIRSSMLDGAVITEIYGGSTLPLFLTKNYIYLHGERIAYHVSSSLNPGTDYVKWVYRNPVIRSLYERKDGSQAVVNFIVDPVGAKVERSDPCTSGEQPPRSDPSAPRDYGYIPDFSCVLDGISTTCDSVMRLLNSGAGVIAPLETTRYNYVIGRFEFFRAFANGYQG